mmetsp:Transcript_46259/g.145095  ORF Transcript_46259/g.145095 Transcript_46259/m.145095 type:complete len:441 (+) Transcript_46259:1320-2642(+)
MGVGRSYVLHLPVGRVKNRQTAPSHLGLLDVAEDSSVGEENERLRSQLPHGTCELCLHLLHRNNFSFVFSVDVVPARAIGDEVELTEGIPSRVHDRLLPCRQHLPAGNLSARIQGSPSKNRRVPRHVRVYPTHPRQLLPILRQTRRSVKVLPIHEHLRRSKSSSLLNVRLDRPDEVCRLSFSTVILYHTDQAAPALVHDHVGEAKLSLWGDGNRIDPWKRQLSIDPLIHEVHKVDDAFVNYEVPTAILVNAAAHVEGGRSQVDRLPSLHLHDNLPTSFIGTRLQPVQLFAIECRRPQPNSPVCDVLGSDGRLPLTVGDSRGIGGLGPLLLPLLRPLKNFSRTFAVLDLLLHPKRDPARPQARRAPVVLEAHRRNRGRPAETDRRSECERRRHESEEDGQDCALHPQYLERRRESGRKQPGSGRAEKIASQERRAGTQASS